MAGAAFGEVCVSLFVECAAFGEVHVSLFVAGATFGEVHVSLFVAGATFRQVHVSLFVVGAAFGEVHVSLFVAGAAFGEVHVSLFVAGATFGEAHASFFVAGAAFGEIWNDSRSGKCCHYQQNLLLGSAKNTLAGEAGCGLHFHGRIGLGSCSEHARIGPALEMTLQLFSSNFSSIWKCNFARQAQY